MVKKIQAQNVSKLEKISIKVTKWIGTPGSIIVHTLLFIGIFGLGVFGFTIDKILLILTTAVSLEAIYLSIFIQMTVVRQSQSLEEIEEDIEDIQEDVEDLSGDVEDITEDMDMLQDSDKHHEKQLEHHFPLEETTIGKMVKKGFRDLRQKHIL